MKWKLKTFKIKDLKENPKNPRYISKESAMRLDNLIEKFGLIEKPIVNTDGTIIGGHQRIRLQKKNRVQEVECWVPEATLDMEQMDELLLGLNLHQGSWDYDLLANQWDIDRLLELGFDEEKLLDSLEIESEEKSDKKSKSSKKSCPNCGHEF